MKARTVRFETQMMRTGVNTTGVAIPPELVAQLEAGVRPPVIAKINDYTYRTTVGVMNGRSMLPFSAQHRQASGIGGGDAVTVELTLDAQPRTIETPDDLARALAADARAAAAFDQLLPSRRKADIENVVGAKTVEIRARRIEALVSRLSRGAPSPRPL
jgi:hypothetical protein